MYLKIDFKEFIDDLKYFEINAFTCRNQKYFTINVSEKDNPISSDVLEVCVKNDHEYEVLNKTLRTLYNNTHI